MKMLACCFAAMLAVPVCVFGGTPAAFTIFDTFPDRADVYGLHLSVMGGATIYSHPNSVSGISLGCIETGVGDGAMRGVQIAGLHAGGECIQGAQVGGAFAMAEKAAGVQLAGLVSMSCDFQGIQIAGLLSQADSCRGLQVAFYNGSASMCGVQIGVLNFAAPAKDGWVFQIGLVNGIGKDEKCTWTKGIRYLPIMNAAW